MFVHYAWRLPAAVRWAAVCSSSSVSVRSSVAMRSLFAQPICVNRVLVRDAQRPRPALAQAIARGIVERDACITDPTQLLGDDIDVLVETALRRGIRVVTANTARRA